MASLHGKDVDTNQTYFEMQLRQQTLKVASSSGDFLDKLEQMRDLVRPFTLRDIEVIKKLTGVKDVSYEDIVFLKRAIRQVLLSQDPNNIQMLKCFTLPNVLQGLCLLMKKF